MRWDQKIVSPADAARACQEFTDAGWSVHSILPVRAYRVAKMSGGFHYDPPDRKDRSVVTTMPDEQFMYPVLVVAYRYGQPGGKGPTK